MTIELVSEALPERDDAAVFTATSFDAAQAAEDLAVEWLLAFTNPQTRNTYAIDIGVRGVRRSQLPGGPAKPRELPPEAWIPWAVANGIDPCGELEIHHVQLYAQALMATHPEAKNTRRRRWYSLCAFYAFLRRKKTVFCDPNELIGGKKGRKSAGLSGADPSPTRAITEKQMRALFVAVQLDTTKHRKRNRALLATLAATGGRTEEIVGLDLADFQRDEPGGPAKVLLDGKGDKKRWQVIPARDADLVEDYVLTERFSPPTSAEVAVAGQMSNRSRVEQPLFTTDKGRRLHVDTIAPLLCRIANIPDLNDPRPEVRAAARELQAIKDKIRPHQIRHSYAVTGENNGKPVSQISSDLGHKNIATTHTYLEANRQAENSAAHVVSAVYHAGVAELDELGIADRDDDFASFMAVDVPTG